MIVKTLCLFVIFVSFCECKGLREQFTWTRIDYSWSSSRNSKSYGSHQTSNKPSYGISFPGATNHQENANNNINPNSVPYTFENNIPMGANVWNGKLFITVPRRRLGVPSTLNYVWLNSTQKHNAPLIPYPDWNTNLLDRTSETNFVSVYRVGVDVCDRLWFVDTGLLELPGNATRVKPASLVIMDLLTDRVLRRHVFPEGVALSASTLASVTIDTTKNDCDGAFAYIPDLAGYGLIIYSLRENRSWRITHNYFFLEPLAGEFSISGHQFQWNDGIFSVALSDLKSDGSRDAYFHSMAGFNLYKVSTRILKNESLATRSFHDTDFQVVGNKGERSQTSSSDLDKSTGILFLGLVNQNALGCWKVGSSLRDLSVVHRDDNKMIYPCDVKVYNNEVILLTNTMPGFLYGRLNYDEVNFRVWIESIAKAVDGTKCANSRQKPSY